MLGDRYLTDALLQLRTLKSQAAHVGQIVLLAKHIAGPNWHSLSIPRGQSTLFDASRQGDVVGVKAGQR